MDTNLLVAIKNLLSIKDKKLVFKTGNSSNRINSVGESLEEFIKDLFCNCFDVPDTEKYKIHSQYFSYLGAKNSPPDIILKGSDAIEIKRAELDETSIIFNSLHPRDKFYSNDAHITSDCRDCEIWHEKDLLYAICTTQGNSLRKLWFVYGDCYFATREFYKKALKITDPLNVSAFNFLDNRGLYGNKVNVQLPNKLIEKAHFSMADSIINALMLKEKYDSFPLSTRLALENLVGDRLSIDDCEIESPNNASVKLNAKLIQYH